MKSKKIIISIIIFFFIGGIVAISGFVFYYFSTGAVADYLSLDEQEATIRAIKNVSPAVVSVKVKTPQNISIKWEDGETENFSESFNLNSGTGFLVSSHGLILTNKHVVSANDSDNVEYQVVLDNQKFYQAKLVDVDPVTDLAFLKIDGENFPHVSLGDSSQLQIGSTVIAIGNSLGEYQNSATKGIISGQKRSILTTDKNGNMEAFSNILQTDAEINLGNSGGPLVDLHGKVVGVNVARSELSSSVGFAIPINDVKKSISTIKEYGRIVRPRLGVRYVMLDPEIAEDLGAPRENGAIIIRDEEGRSAISRDSAAAQAGLQVGDVIFEINAIKLNSQNSLLSIIQKYNPGDKIGIKVQRDDKIFIRELTLGEF